MVPGGLDLNIADEEEFSPDKLRANVERLYMTMVSFRSTSVMHAAHSIRSSVSCHLANTSPGCGHGEKHDELPGSVLPTSLHGSST